MKILLGYPGRVLACVDLYERTSLTSSFLFRQSVQRSKFFFWVEHSIFAIGCHITPQLLDGFSDRYLVKNISNEFITRRNMFEKMQKPVFVWLLLPKICWTLKSKWNLRRYFTQNIQLKTMHILFLQVLQLSV